MTLRPALPGRSPVSNTAPWGVRGLDHRQAHPPGATTAQQGVRGSGLDERCVVARRVIRQAQPPHRGVSGGSPPDERGVHTWVVSAHPSDLTYE